MWIPLAHQEHIRNLGLVLYILAFVLLASMVKVATYQQGAAFVLLAVVVPLLNFSFFFVLLLFMNTWDSLRKLTFQGARLASVWLIGVATYMGLWLGSFVGLCCFVAGCLGALYFDLLLADRLSHSTHAVNVGLAPRLPQGL